MSKGGFGAAAAVVAAAVALALGTTPFAQGAGTIYGSQGGSCNWSQQGTVNVEMNFFSNRQCSDNDTAQAYGGTDTTLEQGGSCNHAQDGTLGLRANVVSNDRCTDDDSVTMENEGGSATASQGSSCNDTNTQDYHVDVPAVFGSRTCSDNDRAGGSAAGSSSVSQGSSCNNVEQGGGGVLLWAVATDHCSDEDQAQVSDGGYAQVVQGYSCNDTYDVDVGAKLYLLNDGECMAGNGATVTGVGSGSIEQGYNCNTYDYRDAGVTVALPRGRCRADNSAAGLPVVQQPNCETVRSGVQLVVSTGLGSGPPLPGDCTDGPPFPPPEELWESWSSGAVCVFEYTKGKAYQCGAYCEVVCRLPPPPDDHNGTGDNDCSAHESGDVGLTVQERERCYGWEGSNPDCSTHREYKAHVMAGNQDRECYGEECGSEDNSTVLVVVSPARNNTCYGGGCYEKHNHTASVTVVGYDQSDCHDDDYDYHDLRGQNQTGNGTEPPGNETGNETGHEAGNGTDPISVAAAGAARDEEGGEGACEGCRVE